MTEAEWLASEDPAFLLGGISHAATVRKLTLFRSVRASFLDYLLGAAGAPGPRSTGLPLISVAALIDWHNTAPRPAYHFNEQERERLGRMLSFVPPENIAQLPEHWPHPASELEQEADALRGEVPGERGAIECLLQTATQCEAIVAQVKDRACSPQHDSTSERVALGIRIRATVHILRDIFGNPFRPVAFDPAWRTNDVVLLARGIYEERAFDRMPILADAIQDAGCDNADLLNHCRDATQPHARGCWVVDLVLGKC